MTGAPAGRLFHVVDEGTDLGRRQMPRGREGEERVGLARPIGKELDQVAPIDRFWNTDRLGPGDAGPGEASVQGCVQGLEDRRGNDRA
jgi:hypothetical protein